MPLLCARSPTRNPMEMRMSTCACVYAHVPVYVHLRGYVCE